MHKGKWILAVGAFFVIGAFLGWFFGQNEIDAPEQREQSQSAEREILYWVAPMDSNYRRDEPGKSPMGMDLVPVYADEVGQGNVSIAPQVVQNLGVESVPVERSRLWQMVRATGQVQLDESQIAHLHLRTGGWITQLLVDSTGEEVKQGQLVAKVYAPEMVNAQEELVQAMKLGNRSMVTAAEKKLAALGVSKEQIERLRQGGNAQEEVSVFAPHDGVVMSLPVREGMRIDPATEILAIADLSQVWVAAEIAGNKQSIVQVGMPAEVDIPSIGQLEVAGEVSFVDAQVDPLTRTLSARIVLPNPDRSLKPNQLVKVRLYGGAKDDVLIVPTDAIIFGSEFDRIVLAEGDGAFVIREVEVGISSGDYTEILAGVSPGEQVVVAGQFLLDSEASASGAITRLRHWQPSSADHSMHGDDQHD